MVQMLPTRPYWRGAEIAQKFGAGITVISVVPKKTVLGSVSAKLAEYAPCSVLVVR